MLLFLCRQPLAHTHTSLRSLDSLSQIAKNKKRPSSRYNLKTTVPIFTPYCCCRLPFNVALFAAPSIITDSIVTTVIFFKVVCRHQPHQQFPKYKQLSETSLVTVTSSHTSSKSKPDRVAVSSTNASEHPVVSTDCSVKPCGGSEKKQ